MIKLICKEFKENDQRSASMSFHSDNESELNINLTQSSPSKDHSNINSVKANRKVFTSLEAHESYLKLDVSKSQELITFNGISSVQNPLLP